MGSRSWSAAVSCGSALPAENFLGSQASFWLTHLSTPYYGLVMEARFNTVCYLCMAAVVPGSEVLADPRKVNGYVHAVCAKKARRELKLRKRIRTIQREYEQAFDVYVSFTRSKRSDELRGVDVPDWYVPTIEKALKSLKSVERFAKKHGLTLKVPSWAKEFYSG